MNDEGNDIDPDSWSFEHIYGISNTLAFTEVDEMEVWDEVSLELQRDENGNQQAGIAANVEFVATYAIHDVDSILGLNAIPYLQGFTSVKDLTIMRLLSSSTTATDGCDAFPIVVHEGIRSVTPPGTVPVPFPDENEFVGDYDYPAYTDFIHHVQDIPLLDAQEGYIYRVWNGLGTGSFGWLRWNEGLLGNAGNLNDTLTWPGRSNDYTDSGAQGQPVPGSGYGWTVYGYIEPIDATDQEMHIGDWVSANTGVGNASFVRDTMDEHINLERTLRLLIWDVPGTSPGNNAMYHISRIAIFRLHGYNLSQGWILAEFIRWDDSCGQVQ
jgi:hypothetical protein